MNVAQMIDHTLLKATATESEIEKLCQEAVQFHFAAVCVNPVFVKKAAKLLKGKVPKVATVVGFPLGASTTAVKVFETQNAIQQGATEIDMVISQGMAKEGRFEEIQREVAEIVAVARPHACVKVILEMCALTQEEKESACKAVLEGGADFLKTSTGFAQGGATVEDVVLMKAACQRYLPSAEVKAAGGIRDWSTAKAMIEAGASRIGTSAGIEIYKQWREENEQTHK